MVSHMSWCVMSINALYCNAMTCLILPSGQKQSRRSQRPFTELDLHMQCQTMAKFCSANLSVSRVSYQYDAREWITAWCCCLFPRLRGFRKNVRQLIPSLRFFSKVEISSRTLISLLRPGSVHSGSASWDDCGRVFPRSSLPRVYHIPL